MKNILYKLFEHKYLGADEARRVLCEIAAGTFNDAQISSLITVFLMRSISVEELSGFRDALLELRTPVDLSDYNVIDIVGTGGDGRNTFNISTAASFVVAGAGYRVVKHGNYGATSVSGSSNVMEQHGVKFTSDMGALRRSIETSGMAFLHAPLFNPALKAVAGVRRNLGVRSFFNMLGPLVNPAMPNYQLLGVYNLPLLRMYAYAYQQSPIGFGVVHSIDGYDEISLTGEFKFVTREMEKIYTPEAINLPRCTEAELDGGSTVQDAARIFRSVLEVSAPEGQLNCVTANAAFAIRVIRPDKSLDDCIGEARESLREGKALGSFNRFLDVNT